MIALELLRRLDSAASSVKLERGEVARALDTDPDTFEQWLRHSEAPALEAQRLSETISILERLSTLLVPQAAHDWLFTANGLLRDERPIDLLEAGDTRRVLGAVEAFAEGIFV